MVGSLSKFLGNMQLQGVVLKCPTLYTISPKIGATYYLAKCMHCWAIANMKFTIICFGRFVIMWASGTYPVMPLKTMMMWHYGFCNGACKGIFGDGYELENNLEIGAMAQTERYVLSIVILKWRLGGITFTTQFWEAVTTLHCLVTQNFHIKPHYKQECLIWELLGIYHSNNISSGFTTRLTHTPISFVPKWIWAHHIAHFQSINAYGCGPIQHYIRCQIGWWDDIQIGALT